MTANHMTVLMTLDAVGGVWRYAMDLATALKPEGIETAFLGFGPGPSPARRAEAEAIGRVAWSDAPLDWLAGSVAALADVPGIVAAAAQAAGADLIHLNLPTQAAGIETTLPVVAVSHSCTTTWFRAVRGDDPPAPWRWQRDLNASGLARADVVVAPTEAHAAALRACYGGIPRLMVVHNSTSAPQGDAGDAGDAPYVIASGRWWDEGKGGATLDAAAAMSRWPVRLLGPLDGPNGTTFAPAQAEALGERPHSEAVSLMSKAGLFASPSLYEPFGLAVAEAARAGLPLVLSDIPSFRELWDNAAVFVPPRDPPALADAINQVANDPAKRRALGQAARERSTRLSSGAQASAMADLYRRLAYPVAHPQQATV